MSTQSVAAENRLGALSKEKSRLLKLLLERKSRAHQKIKRTLRNSDAEVVRLPTSWAQQRLWFIDQLDGRSEVYHIAPAFRLEGCLNEAALQGALDRLVRRHEALRTTFININGEPQQQIAPAGVFALTVIDLSGYEPDERKQQVQRHRSEEVHTRFDLSLGPLIRGRLLQVAPDEHVLLITMHHIISDGWSIGVLIREIGELYRAFATGQDDPLPPLPIQYADYALWQREWLHNVALEKQLSYWRERLAGANAQLELPTDRPRPAVQSSRGENFDIVLDTELAAELRALAQRHDLTLFMVLYTAWTILLSRLSGLEDIVVGTPVANRQQPELEGLIGFFVNTLALRVAVQGDSSLEQLFKHVKDVTLSAYQHQDAPFEQVVEALQPERSLSRNPIFQVMFALQTAPRSTLQLPGVNAVQENELYESSMFDLMFSLEDQGDRIAGTLNYATDLFDRQTIERWIASYVWLLRAMTRDAGSLIGDLPILTGSERQRVTAVFNATCTERPQHELIHELFEQQVARTPSAVALEHKGQPVSYAVLNARANRLAHYLRSRGVCADQPVAICLPRQMEMVVGLLGILKAGGTYLPLDPNYPQERLQQMLEDARPQLLLTHPELQEQLPATTAEVLLLDGDLPQIAACSSHNVPAGELPLTPDNLVYVIYTSGSTGKPKAIAMPHRSMANLLQWHAQSLPLGAGRRVLQFAALSFDVAFQEIFTTLCAGGTLVLVDEWVRRDARELTEFLSRHEIHRLFIPPLMLQSVAEHCQASGNLPAGLQDVICAGEQLRITPEMINLFRRRPGCRLHNHYGPTETHVVTAFTLSGEPGNWPPLPAIGRPIANTQIYILDVRGNPVPTGVAGEIYIGGAGVARGYLHQPDLTAKRFLHDRFSDNPAAIWYRTGDIGMWQPEGNVRYLGRNDDQVKIRGFRIELGDIEAQLILHAAVKEAAVVAREDRPGEKHLVAYITARSSLKPAVEELRIHLKGLLPAHMVPSAFVWLGCLPITSNGKLDRRSLPAPELEAYATEPYVVPQGAVEEVLAKIWQNLLGVARMGRHDNFFELGGHSLLGTKLVARVEEQLGVRLPVVSVFRSPTIQMMAQLIDSEVHRINDERHAQCKHLEYVAMPEPPAAAALDDQALLGAAKSPRAPLSFSQLWHWNLFRLGTRNSARHVVSAIRIRGPLSTELIRAGATAVVRRHEALRTQIVVIDGVPMQETRESVDFQFEIDDLTSLGETQREQEIMPLIHRAILQPIDLATDRLFAFRLLQLADDDCVLIVTLEHLISDGFSMNILLRDLFAAYRYACGGHAAALPDISMQFPEYARLQRTALQPWEQKHGRYWQQRLADYRPVRAPANVHPTTASSPGWGAVPVQIGRELRAQLRQWSRDRRTTLAMTVFTAYVALIMRWCNASDLVIQYQVNSRNTAAVESTIGYFTSILFLRMQLRGDDRFADLLATVISEYCQAHEHADSNYLAAQMPRPGFARGNWFNWIPLEPKLDVADWAPADGALTFNPLHFANPAVKTFDWDNDPEFVLFETEDDVVGTVYFPLSRFSNDSMNALVRSFQAVIAALLKNPEQRVKDIVLPE